MTIATDCQAGVGLTDPDPLYHPEGLTMFDPVPSPYSPDDYIVQKAAHTLGNFLRSAAGLCTGLCQVNTHICTLYKHRC